MNKPDLKKAAKQHIEMNQFMSGDFTLRSAPDIEPPDEPVKTKTIKPDINTAAVTGELEDIAEKVRSCHLCPLADSRKNAVPGEGSPAAQIVFVGEAPGADEDVQGRPFVGRAGKLLDNIINAMGLSRRDVFICNILKCRPPGNRDPKPDEVTKCSPYLQQQLQSINPNIIVALGAHAARTLLDTDKPIGQLRGRFHDYFTDPDAKPIKLMPTYHPAYLLRNYSHDNRLRVWQDMQKVLEEIGLQPPPAKNN